MYFRLRVLAHHWHQVQRMGHHAVDHLRMMPTWKNQVWSLPPLFLVNLQYLLSHIKQMKLVILKMKNPKDKVQNFIQTMMSMDDQMYIDPFHTCTPKTSCIIVVPGDVPKDDKYFTWYFIDMHDNQNKEGTTLLFQITWKHATSNGDPC